MEYVENESKDINYDLMENYFDLVAPTVLAKELFKTKDKNKNSELVELIKVRWSNLKDETKRMSEKEIENEKPNKILKIVEEILDFNNKIQKQQGLGLKILTPDQMLSRLPISLAQLKARNNSLYRSKNLTKKIYIHLINTI